MLILLFVGSFSLAQAQEEKKSHYFYEPLPIPPGEKVMNLGMSMTLLPEPIVEQELPAPAFDFQIKYGITPAFSLFGGASSNYLTNVGAVGFQFSFGDTAFSYSIGDGFIFFGGSFDLGGEFDKNTAAAIANAPVIRFGHRWDEVAISLTFAATYLLHADTRIGSLEDKSFSSKFNDIVGMFALEQPFWGNVRISTGISFTWSRTPYQIWMMYGVFDQYLLLPEFFFSFQL